MKIVRVETLISAGRFPKSPEWTRIRGKLHQSIKKVDWPVGSGKFTIFPQSGKKRGEGNGVKPIKNSLMRDLEQKGWTTEGHAALDTGRDPGDYDAMLETRSGSVVVEWETGNISSSHRSLNKLALSLMKGKIVAGTLVVPTRGLYKYLTDRVGNMQELEPYLELWKAVPCKEGVLEIVAVEHDAESMDVPRIPKATNGRAVA